MEAAAAAQRRGGSGSAAATMTATVAAEAEAATAAERSFSNDSGGGAAAAAERSCSNDSGGDAAAVAVVATVAAAAEMEAAKALALMMTAEGGKKTTITMTMKADLATNKRPNEGANEREDNDSSDCNNQLDLLAGIFASFEQSEAAASQSSPARDRGDGWSSSSQGGGGGWEDGSYNRAAAQSSSLSSHTSSIKGRKRREGSDRHIPLMSKMTKISVLIKDQDRRKVKKANVPYKI